MGIQTHAIAQGKVQFGFFVKNWFQEVVNNPDQRLSDLQTCVQSINLAITMMQEYVKPHLEDLNMCHIAEMGIYRARVDALLSDARDLGTLCIKHVRKVVDVGKIDRETLLNELKEQKERLNPSQLLDPNSDRFGNMQR